MSKSVLLIDTPENCYDCPFGTAYCGELEYVGYCELADCLWTCQRKTMEIIRLIHLMRDLWRVGISALMRLQEVK